MNNELPKGVITSDKLNNADQPVETSKKKFNFKKPNFNNINKKKLLLIVVILFVVFILYCFFASGKGKQIFNNTATEEENKIIEVDVDSDWGKEYALGAQTLFEEKEIDVFDVAFIDLDNKGEPEMIIKYLDKTQKEYLKILYLDPRNSKVKYSKDFNNADIKLIYSLIDGDSDFYLYISNDKKYGTYTLTSKIVGGTAFAPDIKATNEKELNEFVENYVVSDFEIVYYQVKKENYAENFKTMYERVEKYAKEISEEKSSLDKKYKDQVKKKIDENPYLVTGYYHLTYGEYDYIVSADSTTGYSDDGANQDNNAINMVIVLNNDGTIKIDGVSYKYSVNSSVLYIDNGSSIRVIANDKFILSDDGGMTFESRNPYVEPVNNDNGENNSNNNDNNSNDNNMNNDDNVQNNDDVDGQNN